jgi:hypothetical protein
MSNVRRGGWSDNLQGQDHTGGGNPPGGGNVEARVAKLEATMSDVQVRLIRIESSLEHMATKADLHEMATTFHKAMNEQTWKFLAGATGMSALFATIAFGLARVLS